MNKIDIDVKSGSTCFIVEASDVRVTGGKRSSLPRFPRYFPEDASVQGSRKKPLEVVVVLIGFMGASEKNMLKYVRIYNELLSNAHRSVKCLVFIPPISCILASGLTVDTEKNGFDACAKEILDLLKSNHFIQASNDGRGVQQSKTLLHVMSQNGCFTYLSLIKHQLNDFDAVVFDSGPVKMTRIAISRAINAAVGSLIGNALLNAVTFLHGGHAKFESFLKQRIENIEFDFMTCESNAHELYLYSSADVITDANYVSAIAKRREQIYKGLKSNRKIMRHDFCRTDHVAHLSAQPEVYKQTLLKFLLPFDMQMKSHL
jgi:hypothetical protein